jgi:hypothetical protein
VEKWIDAAISDVEMCNRAVISRDQLEEELSRTVFNMEIVYQRRLIAPALDLGKATVKPFARALPSEHPPPPAPLLWALCGLLSLFGTGVGRVSGALGGFLGGSWVSSRLFLRSSGSCLNSSRVRSAVADLDTEIGTGHCAY